MTMAAKEVGESFGREWQDAINTSKNILEDEDLRMIGRSRSWDNVRNILSNSDLSSFRQILSSLEDLKTFVGFFETGLGANLDASFFRGTLTRLLHLVKRKPKDFGEVSRMIRSLVDTAEKFNRLCKDTQEIEKHVKEACFDMHIQILEFLRDSIKYIHTGNQNAVDWRTVHQQASEHPVYSIEKCFTKIQDALNKKLKRIENLAETSALIRAQSASTTGAMKMAVRKDVHMLPPTRIPAGHFFNRSGFLVELDSKLYPVAGDMSFQSVVVHGIGGGGKSTAISYYVEERHEAGVYNVILWVQGDSPSSLRQSFTKIAIRLELPGARFPNHDENLSLVQNWLQSQDTTDCKWLIVYDNVVSGDDLMPYWPESRKGKAIITTRNPSVGFPFRSTKLEIPTWDAQKGSRFLKFLLKKIIARELKPEEDDVLIFSERLGGYPLGIAQVAGLIDSGLYSIQEFMNMYPKEHVHGMEPLAVFWKTYFKQLSDEDSRTLLGIMSFLSPDEIPQEIFENGFHHEDADNLHPRSNKSRFWGGLNRLLSLSLVRKDTDSLVLSIHRTVQEEFKNFLTLEKRQICFNIAVNLIYNVIPKEETLGGQLYDKWEFYKRYLSHILALKKCFEEEKKNSNGTFTVSWDFCKLLVQFQRFLYETNALTDLESFCDFSLKAVATLENGQQKNSLEADIMSYQANLAESLGHAEEAIALNTQVYNIRLREQPQQVDLIGYLVNNLGYCYNTANDHDKSRTQFKQLEKWCEQNHREIPYFARKNMARCLAYLGEFDEARNELAIAMSGLENEENWAMLAYAYFVLGTIERRQEKFTLAEAAFRKAQSLWMTGQKSLHPFNGACMYKIGVCCLEQGKVDDAITHIRESMEITDFHKESMPVEHARSMFQLSKALDRNDNQHEAEKMRYNAELYLKQRNQNVVDYDTEDVYDKHIPIFWR